MFTYCPMETCLFQCILFLMHLVKLVLRRLLIVLQVKSFVPGGSSNEVYDQELP